MFYKIAKTLSKVTIVFGFMCMVGGCSVEQQELFYLYEALDSQYLLSEHMHMNTSECWNTGTGKEK